MKSIYTNSELNELKESIPGVKEEKILTRKERKDSYFTPNKGKNSNEGLFVDKLLTKSRFVTKVVCNNDKFAKRMLNHPKYTNVGGIYIIVQAGWCNRGLEGSRCYIGRSADFRYRMFQHFFVETDRCFLSEWPDWKGGWDIYFVHSQRNLKLYRRRLKRKDRVFFDRWCKFKLKTLEWYFYKMFAKGKREVESSLNRRAVLRPSRYTNLYKEPKYKYKLVATNGSIKKKFRRFIDIKNYLGIGLNQVKKAFKKGTFTSNNTRFNRKFKIRLIGVREGKRNLKNLFFEVLDTLTKKSEVTVSAIEACNVIGCNRATIYRNLDTGKLIKKRWIVRRL